MPLKKAEKEVSKLKGKTKKTWEARLSSKVETPYKNATTYINVVNAAKELDITNNQLNSALINGEWDASVAQVQSQFRQDVKEFSQSISKVNGAATKKALRNSYVKKFMKTDQSIIYANSLKRQFAQLDQALEVENIDKAQALQEMLEKRLANFKKRGYITG